MRRAATHVAAALAAALAFHAAPSRAVGPHETALVVNGSSVESVVLAAVWARLRSVPESNVVRVSIPPGPDGKPPEAITAGDFRRFVLDPVSEALESRGVSGQILAWVYSCGMPARVTASKAGLSRPSTNDFSLAGATFLRGNLPESDHVVMAEYASPLYAGPDAAYAQGGTNVVASGFAGRAMSFDRRRNELLDRMPLPSFMLSWTGVRGLSLDAAVEALERAAAADCTAPTGTVAFVRRKDVRDHARAWQYETVADDLEAMSRGVSGAILDSEPGSGDGPLLGYMTGAVSVSPLPELAPGAYADHFTSYAAAFGHPTQMKASRWIESGAAFSSGTVCEPFAIWSKFPTAWIFTRLVSGATAIEAFYASVRCPLQIQPVGDPLCAPWAPRISPSMEPDAGAAEPFGGPVRLNAEIPGAGDGGSPEIRFSWYVDGRFAGTGPTLFWDAGAETPGSHEVRLVARLQDESERPQGFVLRSFDTAGRAEGGW